MESVTGFAGMRTTPTFRVFGWLAIAAAVALPFVGRVRINALLGWFEGKPTFLIRIWLIFGVAVGAFLVHAV